MGIYFIEMYSIRTYWIYIFCIFSHKIELIELTAPKVKVWLVKRRLKFD